MTKVVLTGISSSVQPRQKDCEHRRALLESTLSLNLTIIMDKLFEMTVSIFWG